MARLTPEDQAIRDLLTTSPTVAVLGIHTATEKPAFYVPEYLFDEGYRILGVNPTLEGEVLFGQPIRATLAAITEPVDLVDVFRLAQHLPGHVADILAMTPLPKVVWFQLGIRNDAVARQLEAAGITVVQDRCTLADHQRMGLGAPR
ncbi:MAG: CoA-binding protein [Proteobacteria bacterium]|nr:CoA-binding protein [Pseudomonadota bacterium]